MTRLPVSSTAKKSVQLVNYRNIILSPENKSVYLNNASMRIGFGGLAKGYAAECAKLKLREYGADSGIINASGDLTTWGNSPQGKPWTLGIADPYNRLNVFSEMELHDMSIATSGDFEKYIITEGKRITPTINPRAGYPVKDISSVSIISPNAELSHKLTTPVMVMGKSRGLSMINQLKEIACIIVDAHQQIFTSDNLRLK